MKVSLMTNLMIFYIANLDSFKYISGQTLECLTVQILGRQVKKNGGKQSSKLPEVECHCWP